MDFWVLQTLNGLSFGMLLFLLAAGLSLTLGLMNIVNLAHGSYYLLGAYLGLTVFQRTGNFVLAVIGAAVCMGILGILMQLFLLRYLQKLHLAQVLLTIGCVFILGDLSLVAWGGSPQAIPKPPPFNSSIAVGDAVFPSYRLLVIAIGVVVALLLWLLQERTIMGASVRAAVDNEEMAGSTGINVARLMTVVFGLGAALAAISGVLGGASMSIYQGADMDVLLLALVVVILGGMGSLKGAFVAALLVGLLDNFGKAMFPEISQFTIFAPMAIMLAVRPTGLFGRA
ncbi:MAG: branched-chain amino acid ABC transporter permease [Dehalococcoidia bacterium]|nr:branched-chain amino acid ABC transporter permease [Dehalococcoidia bacterium]